MRNNRALQILVITALFPVFTILVSYLDHRYSFNGICGPHATDIPAHPCDFPTYMAEFGGGFSGVGLFALALVAAFVGLVVAVIATRKRAKSNA